MKRALPDENRRKGFTLMEMLVVIAVIAVLTAVAIPTFSGSLDAAKEATCAANRRAAYAEMNIAAMTGEGETPEQILARYQGKCPSRGKYTVETSAHGVLSLFCSKHGTDVAGDLLRQFEDLTQNWSDKEQYPDYTGGFNNDLLRKYLYKNLGNAWPTLTYRGTVYYIQPCIYRATDAPILFARVKSGADSGWYTTLVYSGGVWYYNSAGKSINTDTPETLAETVKDTKYWKALEFGDYTIKAGLGIA